MASTALNDQTVAMGLAVPPFTAHAISVSLPTWKDNVGYEVGEKRVVDAMVSGYPRFFIHLSIGKLARICEQRFGASGESCLLCPSKKAAEHCRAYLVNQSSQSGSPVLVRLVQYFICPEAGQGNDADIDRSLERARSPPLFRSAELHIVLFPTEIFPLAKQFWQHTGMGISSRLAEHCLSMLPEESSVRPAPPSPTLSRPGRNKHYSAKGSISPTNCGGRNAFAAQQANLVEDLSKDQNVYLEERYGRNLPVGSAAAAKHAMRRRIAGVLVRDSPEDCSGKPCAGAEDAEIGPSSRGVTAITENDVYLFPTGMTAIWNAHHLASMTRPAAKSVCFGFSYTDTIKILQKWGPGCHFLGHGLDTDIDNLEEILEQKYSYSPSTPPVLALFTEFPSNPLLRSPNLPRLRSLADKYDFLIVVDETIGNFVNVEVVPYADIVVSSLSKVFSGDANVMGGSLVLNPVGRHYRELKAYMAASYEDAYFDEDAIYMERNSRDFRRRTPIIDDNTEAICEFLRSRSIVNGASSSVIKEVFYPKWITRDNYERCRIKGARSNTGPRDTGRDGGFGGLFSLTFTTAAASRAFFDSLSCLKGPSLGTNFTLACPYTILAHFAEMQWAAEYGVEESLIRVSVGMEEKETLLRCFEEALKAAEGTSES